MEQAIQNILDNLSEARRGRLENAFWSAYGSDDPEAVQYPIAAKKIAEYITEIVKFSERREALASADQSFEDGFTEV